jgi:hypothetical protein
VKNASELALFAVILFPMIQTELPLVITY